MASALEAPGEVSYSRARRGLIITSVMMGTTVAVLDFSLVSVALPHMQGSFSATQDQISWVVTGFIVGLTTAGACLGWVADRIGRKRLFLIGVSGFTAAYVLCGSAGSLGEEVLWRALQGMFSAPLIPLSQAICLDAYPRREHGRVNTIWSLCIMVGPVIGPIAGGMLIELYGWRSAFFIMVPAGALSALGSWAFVPETPRRPERRLDWLGFTMLILALGAFQLMLNRGQRLDWFGSTEIVIAAVVAALAFYLFVVQSLTSAHPFLEPRTFKDRNVATGMAVGLVWGLLLNGIVVLFSLLMQNLRGYPVVTMGLLLVPRGLGMMLALIVVQRLMGLIDERHLIACGMLSMAATGWLASGWDANVGTWEVATAGALQGFSTGFSWVPLVTKAFSTVARRLRTEGLVVFHLLIQIGQGAGVAIAINILSRTSNISHASLTEHVTRYNEVLRGPDIPELWDPGSMSGLAAIEGEISRQAEMIGYLNNFHYLMVLSLVAIPLVYLFRRRAFGGPTPPDD